jgi:hypothetical protein
MTFYIRIQFPDGIVAWELGAKDQAAALHAANELAGPDGKVISWSRHKSGQW